MDERMDADAGDIESATPRLEPGLAEQPALTSPEGGSTVVDNDRAGGTRLTFRRSAPILLVVLVILLLWLLWPFSVHSFVFGDVRCAGWGGVVAGQSDIGEVQGLVSITPSTGFIEDQLTEASRSLDESCRQRGEDRRHEAGVLALVGLAFWIGALLVVRDPAPGTAGGTMPPSGDDPLVQIAKLAELRDAAVLSDEEFAAQKRRLLSLL